MIVERGVLLIDSSICPLDRVILNGIIEHQVLLYLKVVWQKIFQSSYASKNLL